MGPAPRFTIGARSASGRVPGAVQAADVGPVERAKRREAAPDRAASESRVPGAAELGEAHFWPGGTAGVGEATRSPALQARVREMARARGMGMGEEARAQELGPVAPEAVALGSPAEGWAMAMARALRERVQEME